MNEIPQDPLAPGILSSTLKVFSFLALGLVGVFLGGCKCGPDFKMPNMDAPATWAGVAKRASSASFATTTNAADIAQWWKTFNDPVLTRLVHDAVATNLDLRIAQVRVREARASRGVAAGGLWPAASTSAAYQRVHSAGTMTPNQDTHDLFVAGLDAVWELDVFGGLRRNVESAG